MNEILHGDCLDALKRFEGGYFDLAYADPPFNTGKDWNDYDDRWPTMAEYIDWLRARVREVKRVLKPEASFYLHCDQNAGHYIKVMLDEELGAQNFRNEIVWAYKRMPSKQKQYQRSHDVIFFYAGDGRTWNWPKTALSESSRKTHQRAKIKGYNVNISRNMATIFDWDKYREAVKSGRLPEGLKETEFSGECPPERSWWNDIRLIKGKGGEGTGYATQKPLGLLERIIAASSNEGDKILDPFCGSGTTLVAAKKLNRNYVGIDINEDAVRISRERLAEQCRPQLEIRQP